MAADAVADDCAPVESRCFPSAEEMRMVRAIALLALLEAARHGEYRATFHGFRVEAVRHHGLGQGAPTVEVRLAVTLAGTVVERCDLDVGVMRSSFGDVEGHRTQFVGAETFAVYDGH